MVHEVYEVCFSLTYTSDTPTNYLRMCGSTHLVGLVIGQTHRILKVIHFPSPFVECTKDQTLNKVLKGRGSSGPNKLGIAMSDPFAAVRFALLGSNSFHTTTRRTLKSVLDKLGVSTN